MKVLIIAPQPFFEKRGTPLAVSLLARALGELGHEIDLLTYHIGAPWAAPLVRHIRAPRVPFISSVGKGLSATKVFLDVFVFIKAFWLLLRNRYDVVHGVEEGAMMGIVLKGFFGVPLIYDMDSSIPCQIIESGSRLWTLPPLLFLAKWLERITLRKSDLVIAVCNALRDRVVLLAPDTSAVVVEDIPVVEKAPAGLDEDIKRIREELRLGHSPCVVYTGTFEHYQGVTLLLESIPVVCKLVPGVIFILVGGQANQMAEVMNRARQLALDDNIRILGRRPLEEMPAFMHLADVLVSPRTLGDNTPMKLYAYLQSGRPVVATRLPTHTQVLNNDIAVLAEPEPNSFASAITSLLGDSALRERIGTAGADFVAKNYNYESFRNKLDDAYSRIKSC